MRERAILDDLEYFISKKASRRDFLREEGKDYRGVDAELRSLERVRDALVRLDAEYETLLNAYTGLRREYEHLERYKDVAIGVSAARKWATATNKPYAKIFLMLEENPSHYEELYNALYPYKSYLEILIIDYEMKHNYYDDADRHVYIDLCRKCGFEELRRLENWRHHCDTRLGIVDDAILEAGRKYVLSRIPELKELLQCPTKEQY